MPMKETLKTLGYLVAVKKKRKKNCGKQIL